MNVLFDELAGEELNDAVEYYELQIQGLVRRFKDEIKRTIRTIKNYPEIGVVEEGDIRRHLLHKFSYKILDSIEKNYIYLIAIAHTHREPNYWIRRILKKKL